MCLRLYFNFDFMSLWLFIEKFVSVRENQQNLSATKDKVKHKGYYKLYIFNI